MTESYNLIIMQRKHHDSIKISMYLTDQVIPSHLLGKQGTKKIVANSKNDILLKEVINSATQIKNIPKSKFKINNVLHFSFADNSGRKRAPLPTGTYGKTTIISYSHSKKNTRYFNVRCVCGKEYVKIYNKVSFPGGCKRGCDKPTIKSLFPTQELYNKYVSAKYHNLLCHEWAGNPQLFVNWVYSNGYKDGMTIARRDPASLYSPENCHLSKKRVSHAWPALTKRNQSGYQGVSYKKTTNKWIVNCRRTYLGSFDTAKEALECYNKYIHDNKLMIAKQEYNGEPAPY